MLTMLAIIITFRFFYHIMHRCGTSQGGNFSSPGVWYEVIGSGSALDVQVSATYDVQLSIFESDCESLVCVAGSEGMTTDFFKAYVIWESELGKEYKILVHGFSGQVGEFELFFEEVTRPANDRCEDAINIDLFDVVPGSNELAGLDELADCGEFC
jgi:hypothetical protein